MIKYILLFITGFLALPSCSIQESINLPNEKGVIAENAMVVSAHPLATQVGLDVLRAGGNAIDAAVAVQFALAVVYPGAGNIGGGGFLVYRNHDGNFLSLDYREKAPSHAKRNMYLDESGEVDPQKSRLGHLAAGVPGSVDGMFVAHSKLGSRPWKELIQPAIDLATNGFALTEKEANKLNNAQERFIEFNTESPTHLLKPNWNKGDTIFYIDLGETLSRIAQDGRSGFYEGKTAELIVDEMKRGGGLITKEDLRNYHAIWRKPISFHYKKYRVTSMGPPSSGGVAIAQLFSMATQFPLHDWSINDQRYVHTITELEKLVYADRAKYLGDADFVDVPIEQLTSSAYNFKRAKNVNLKKAIPSDEIDAGTVAAEHEETTHFSIVDAFGNAVSSTTTLNGGFGNHVVVGGAGFFLNNEMDDFSAKPGSPNMYGLIGGEANAITPGKRMLSSMTPTIVEKDNELFMVVGTPGGSTIITSVFQTIVNVIDFDMNMQGAIDYPRFHHQWKPDLIQHEQGRFDTQLIEKLHDLGHSLKERSSIGRVDGILILQDGYLEGGADHRGDDTALGY